jgi:hypothetical protein
MTSRTVYVAFVAAPVAIFLLGFVLANVGESADLPIAEASALPPEATCRQVRDARAAAAVAAAAAASQSSGSGYGRGTGGYSGGGGWSGGK